jgi:hypothetical protein
MSTPKPEAVLELEGRLHKLSFDNNCWLGWETETKRPITEANLGNPKDLQMLLYLMLKEEEPDITFEATGKMFGWWNLLEVQTAIAKCIGLSLPMKKEEPSEAPNRT